MFLYDNLIIVRQTWGRTNISSPCANCENGQRSKHSHVAAVPVHNGEGTDDDDDDDRLSLCYFKNCLITHL